MDYELIKAEALEKGYTDIQADAIIATLKAREKSGKVSDYLLDYPLWKTGNYSAVKGGSFTVDDENINQTDRAVNMLHAMGKPIQMIDGHRSTNHLGGIPVTRIGSQGKLRAVLVGDPNTIAGIRERALGLSIEAKQHYTSEEYTNGEEFRYWPTAWAVLPVGTQQAVTPGEPLAASEDDNKPVRLFAQETTPDRGNESRKGDEMDKDKRIAELEAGEATNAEKFSTLEAANADLTTQLDTVTQERDSLKSAKEQEEIEAAEKAVEDSAKTMVAKKLPGVRETVLAEIMACEGSEARATLTATLDKLLPDMSPAEQKLEAGESKPESSNSDNSNIEAAEMLAEKENISFVAALGKVIERKREKE